jgi:hypothetical protein
MVEPTEKMVCGRHTRRTRALNMNEWRKGLNHSGVAREGHPVSTHATSLFASVETLSESRGQKAHRACQRPSTSSLIFTHGETTFKSSLAGVPAGITHPLGEALSKRACFISS